MGRYNNTKIARSKKNQFKEKTFNRYRTTIYQGVSFSNSDIYVISQDGDRLDLLAHQFYGDSSLWWYIAQANHLNAMNIEPGTSLRIPASIKPAKGD